MEANTLWNINWGDNDNTFVIAPDKETALQHLNDGKDMVNYVVSLDIIYQQILRAGMQKVVDFVEEARVTTDYYQEDGSIALRRGDVLISSQAWQDFLKENGLESK